MSYLMPSPSNERKDKPVMRGSAATYLAGDIHKVVPGVPLSEIATLLLELTAELWNCRHVTNSADAAKWLNSMVEKDGRRRRAKNEIGRLWRGRLTHYGALEEAILMRCLVVTADEMAGLFDELTSGNQ